MKNIFCSATSLPRTLNKGSYAHAMPNRQIKRCHEVHLAGRTLINHTHKNSQTKIGKYFAASLIFATILFWIYLKMMNSSKAQKAWPRQKMVATNKNNKPQGAAWESYSCPFLKNSYLWSHFQKPQKVPRRPDSLTAKVPPLFSIGPDLHLG